MQIREAVDNSVQGSKIGAAVGSTSLVLFGFWNRAEFEDMPPAAVAGGALGAAIGAILGGLGTLVKDAAGNWCSRR